MDSPLYLTGLKDLENGLLTKFGAVKSRGGFEYIGSTLTNDLAILVPFSVPGTGEYLIEVGGSDGSTEIRFYKEDGADSITLLAAGTVTSPYLEADLFDLQWKQDKENQKIYFTHKDYEPRVITRTSDTSWAIATHDTSDTGPILIPRGKSFTVSPL